MTFSLKLELFQINPILAETGYYTRNFLAYLIFDQNAKFTRIAYNFS